MRLIPQGKNKGRGRVVIMKKLIVSICAVAMLVVSSSAAFAGGRYYPTPRRYETPRYYNGGGHHHSGPSVGAVLGVLGGLIVLDAFGRAIASPPPPVYVVPVPQARMCYRNQWGRLICPTQY